MGFEAEIKSNKEIEEQNALSHLNPEDLIKYGLIPEFVGRLPVIAVLDELDKDALVQILTEPKNALTKQYNKMFSFEDIELEFTDQAIEEIAAIAIDRKAGARGLRAVLESLMLDLMYEIPSMENVLKITITAEMVRGEEGPEIEYEKEKSA